MEVLKKEVAKSVKQEISLDAKQKVSGLIQQAGLAITLRDNFIEGLAAGLELEGKWNFSYNDLCFTKIEEPKCQDTVK
jgi:hypothetical protein